MNAAGGSNIGQRKDNEDRYEIRSVEMPNGDVVQLLVIADGMGGHEHGQLASRIAVEQFAQLEADTLPAEFSLEHMRLLFQTANSRINALQEHLHDGIMGTTLTAAVVKQDQLYLGHVGDSRCYMYRDGELIQISVDHTYYAELIRRGQEISLNDEKQKNVLMKALGPEAYVEGQYLQQIMRADDVLMLCTDGLYNAVSTEDIIAVCESVRTGTVLLDQAVDILLNKGVEQGARDNLTLILYLHDKKEI